MTNLNKALLKIKPTDVGYVSLNGTYPQYWFPWGNYIAIEPVPDAQYQLLFYIADYPEYELTEDSDIPYDLPFEFHPCVVDFALYTLSMKLKRWEQAARYYNAYVRNLKIRKAEYVKRKAEQRAIHNIPDNVKGNTLRKEVDARSSHKIPDNVVYQGGRAWAH